MVGQMSYFIIGGTNVMVGQMSYSIIGGTNVTVVQMSYFIIGGTNVRVGQMSGWDKCQVGQTSVGQTSVALVSVGQKSRHHVFRFYLNFSCCDNDVEAIDK
jgi:hypothetical protein